MNLTSLVVFKSLDFSNHQLPRLIDALAALRLEMSELVADEKALTAEIKRRMLNAGMKEAEGDLFRAILDVSERVTVNIDEVRKQFPALTNPQLYASALVETLRTPRKE